MTFSVKKLPLFFLLILQSGLMSHGAHPMLFHSPDQELIDQFFGDQKPPESVTLNVDDRQFHFMDLPSDSSTVIIFVHGSPGGWDAFMPYFKILELRDRFRLISVDRPGFGKSSFGNSERSLRKQATVISKVFDFLSPDQRVILIGHSLGGPVIAQLAIDFPERVQALLFIAASMDPDLEKTRWLQHPAQWFIIRSLVPDAWRVSNEEILALKSELFLQQPRLTEITVPVIVMQGDQDELVPPANVDYIIRNLSSTVVRAKKYPALNHFIPFSHRDLVVKAILDLAKEIENPDPVNEINAQD